MDFAWSEDNHAEVEMGLIRKAETTAQLAGNLGCSQDTIRETLPLERLLPWRGG